MLVARLSASGEPVAAVLQGIGEEQGRALRAQLGYGRDPREVAHVVTLANRLYDIRARVHRCVAGGGAGGHSRVSVVAGGLVGTPALRLLLPL